MNIRIVQGNIADATTDAVVNASNQHLLKEPHF